MKKLIITALLIGSTIYGATAQSFLRPNNNPQFNPYVPQVDVNLYREVITSKQNNYNKNYQEIQELIDDLSGYVDELFKLNPERGELFFNEIGKYITSLSKSKPDLADYVVYYNIQSNLKEYIRLTKKAIKEEY